MSVQLVPCGACARHVKVTDATCPFCGADVATSAAAAAAARAGLPPRPPGRLSRAALIAASAAGALAATDCSSSSTTSVPLYGASVPPLDGGDDADMTEPLYGAPVLPDASAADSGHGNPIPLYGAFPIDGAVPPRPGDAGADAASMHDGGSIQPLYGAFIPPEGGPNIN